MNDDRSKRWINRGIPAVVCLLAAASFVCVGIFFALYPVLVRYGNGSGPGLEYVAIGAGLSLVGAALVWLARWVWHTQP
jgi:hypothetical protein